MKQLKYLIILVGCIAFTSLSCSKDEDNTENVKQILTNGNWYTESLDLSISMALGAQQFTMLTCQEDDTTVFYKDGKMKQFQGETICDSYEYIAIQGSWQVTDQGKSLIIIFDELGASNLNLKFNIIEISEKRINITIDYSTKVNESDYSLKGEIIFYKK